MITVTRRLIELAASKPVLLTGSSGYVGSKLAEELRKHDIGFLGVDKTPGDTTDRQFNLANEALTRDAVSSLAPGFVVHTGTHSALAYRADFLTTFKEDADSLINLLGALRERPETRFVFFSSSYVYGALDKGARLREDTMLNPAHNFGVAKAFFEQLVLRLQPNSVVFRLSSVFGYGAQAHPNAIAEMCRQCQTEGRLTVWGTGERRMQYVYLDDVISYTFEGLALPPGIYNLGGDEYTSVAATAKMIAQFFASDSEFLTDKREGDALPFMETLKLKTESTSVHSTPLAVAMQEYLRGFTST